MPSGLCKRQAFKWPAHYFACYWPMTVVGVRLSHITLRNCSTRGLISVSKGHCLTSIFMLKVVYKCNPQCVKYQEKVTGSKKKIDKGTFFK